VQLAKWKRVTGKRLSLLEDELGLRDERGDRSQEPKRTGTESFIVSAEEHVAGEELTELRRYVYSCMRDERAPMSPNVALALIDRCIALSREVDALRAGEKP